jgi:hypothetical protein
MKAWCPKPQTCAQLDFELHRSHPLVTVLAEHLLENALQGETTPTITARCAATITDAVDVVTTVYLLRLRHQLGYVRRRQPFQMMAEETVALAVAGRSNPQVAQRRGSGRLLECQPTGNLPREAMQREVVQALDFLAHPQQLQAWPRTRPNPAGRPPPRARSRPRCGPVQRQPLPAGGCDGCVCPAARRSVTRWP